MAHKGTSQVKKSKVYMLTTQYEAFSMKEGESILEKHTRCTAITNELHYLDEAIKLGKQVWKVLIILPKSWKNKVDVVTEARDLKTLIMEELIANLKTHELKKQQKRK